MSEIILFVEDLKTYFYTPIGTLKAVDGVSFNLREEEVLGVAGESGCGKSTTALSIMRLIKQSGRIVDGTINYRGIDLVNVNDEELCNLRGKKIAMTFQQSMYALNPVLRIRDQLTECLTRDGTTTKVEAEKKAKELFRLLDLQPSRIGNYPCEFSGGMKQRALIAMSLMCNPEILILDEPTTALDVVVQNQLIKLISRLQKEMKLSVIWITHDLPVLVEISDRIAIMYAGKIVEESDTSTIIHHPKHPYTKGLLGAVPTIDNIDREITPIPGTPPDLINPPNGCRFYPRCPYKADICANTPPRREKTPDGSFIQCHRWRSI